MTDIPAVSFDRLIRAVGKLGFKRVRQRGSHIRFFHPDGRKTTVPDHGQRDVPKGLLFKIVRHDLEMSMDDFLEMLK
jgi:predicted RNA binding protein YcfA (HicA-like mRNA interferase family)